MTLFDDGLINITNIKIEARAERALLKKSHKAIQRNENCQNLIKSAGGFPNEGEIISFLSNGASDTGGFFSSIIEEFGIIDEMYLSTWTISKQNVIRILDAIDAGQLKEFSFLINDGLLKTNSTKSIYSFLSDEFNARKIKFKAINSHAKIFCVRCGNRYITVSGSGNWSENPRIENYMILGSKDIFNFNKSWMVEQVNL